MTVEAPERPVALPDIPEAATFDEIAELAKEIKAADEGDAVYELALRRITGGLGYEILATGSIRVDARHESQVIVAGSWSIGRFVDDTAKKIASITMTERILTEAVAEVLRERGND